MRLRLNAEGVYPHRQRRAHRASREEQLVKIEKPTSRCTQCFQCIKYSRYVEQFRICRPVADDPAGVGLNLGNQPLPTMPVVVGSSLAITCSYPTPRRLAQTEDLLELLSLRPKLLCALVKEGNEHGRAALVACGWHSSGT